MGGKMKNLSICMTALLFLAIGAAAQDSPVDKGSFMISGQASYTSLGGDLFEDYAGNSINLIAINPGIGYFTTPGFMIGGDFSILHASWSDDADATLIGLGPKIAYFFNAKQDRTEQKGAFYPYIEAFGQYFSVSLGNNDASAFLYGGKVGFISMITNSVAIDAAVTYSGLSFKPDGADDSISGNILSVGVGLSQFIW